MSETTYTVRVSPDDDGSLVAEVLELPGCIASGDDLPELEANLKEAIEVYLSTEDVHATIVAFSLNQPALFGDDSAIPTRVDLALA